MKREIVLSVIADDHPGIVQTLAETITARGGNWLESSMSHLGGKFAGIVLLEVSESREKELEGALRSLDQGELHITFERTAPCRPQLFHYVMVNIVANDRPGIVEEISELLARHDVNIESLTTSIADTPLSSGHLFKARFQANLSEDVSYDELQRVLESASDDLIVELDEHPWPDTTH
ncbi:MAG: Glycine cleavage system transcriptional repressor [Gammaproteobacteria bacterium]|nr:Glycine cleavage system transcriptional repressor [Gammaproteobacteria bacterium]